MKKENKNKWESIGQLLTIGLVIAFYGGLFLWIEIEECGGFTAMFQDKDRLLANILPFLAKFVR